MVTTRANKLNVQSAKLFSTHTASRTNDCAPTTTVRLVLMTAPAQVLTAATAAQFTTANASDNLAKATATTKILAKILPATAAQPLATTSAKMSTPKCSHLTAGESGGSQPTGW